MNYYFAPMEGLTDRIYRRTHHEFFPGMTQYYMPFISPTMHHALTPREKRDLPLAGEDPFTAIPQVLTKSAEDFLWAARQCADRGYSQINLNLGCPSGTVVSKGKGAGMLADVSGLDRFLDAVFSDAPLPISLKTRLGLTDPEEFPAILAVFNRYPCCELIIHPRVRKQFYDGSVHMDAFRDAVQQTDLPLCYNGDLRSAADIDAFRQEFPQVGAIMLGRGLIADPGMLTPGITEPSTLRAFMDTLLERYIAAFGSARNAMFRMKENWAYMLPRFGNSERIAKRLRKTTDITEYKAITAEIFETLSFPVA